MPLINFQCKDCGDKFSELVYSHNKDQVRCPSCSGAVEQIYEGKCNSLSGSSGTSPISEPCHSCPMGCKH
jgi:putative FmdB family regulatory protein